jgi:uncharacterized ParB-like nuclease family protein
MSATQVSDTKRSPKRTAKKQTAPKKRLEALIKALKMSEVIHMDIGDVKNEYSLQKRTRRGDDKHTAKRLMEESKELIASISASLTSEHELQTTPIWLVNTDTEGLKLVDGHHRFHAYTKAGREKIPTQIINGSMEDAHLLADAANNQTQTLKVTKQEQMEIAWTSLKRLYNGTKWAEGYTNREFARTRSIAHGTVDTMVKRFRELGDVVANRMTWREAKFSGDSRVLDAETRVEGWINKINNLLLVPDEMKVLAELIYDMSNYDLGEDVEDVAKDKAIKAISKLNGWNNPHEGTVTDVELDF